MVKSESVWQRRKALWALGRLPAPVAADAMPVIRAALDDPDGRTRWRAFVTLCQHDPAAAREKLPPAWQDAVDAASSRGPDFAAIKTWCQCNWHRKHAVLQPATSFEVLATDLVGPHTFGDVEGLFEQGRLEGTLTALEKAARQGPAGTRFLVAVFQTASRDQWSRERFGVRALRLLEREGPGAAAAAPVLVDSLNAYLGHEAMAQALLAIGDPAVEALAAALRDPERRPLGLLAMVQRFGPRGKLASPAVLHCLQSPDEKVQRAAVVTFKSLGAAAVDAVPELRKLLASDQPRVRQHAAETLGNIGPEAKAALPELIGLFKEDNQTLRVVSVRAVSQLGKEAVEPLTRVLGDAHEQARLSAVEALALMGPAARPALPALRKLETNEPGAAVREAAKKLIEKLQTN